MRISNIKVQFQMNAGPKINAGGVYFKFDRVDPAFIRGPAFNWENTVLMCAGLPGNTV